MGKMTKGESAGHPACETRPACEAQPAPEARPACETQPASEARPSSCEALPPSRVARPGVGALLAQLRHELVRSFRMPANLIWALLFPVLMALVFSLMFSGFDELYATTTVRAGVLADANYQDAPLLRAVLDGAAADDGILAFTTSDDEAELARATLDGELDGYLTVDAAGTPTLHVSPLVSGSFGQATLEVVVERCQALAQVVATLVREDPAALADPDALAAFVGDEVTTQALSVLHTTGSESSRYYDALFGMAALIASTISLHAVWQVNVACGDVARRRRVAPTSPAAQLAVAVLASWIATFACLLVAFGWTHLVLGVDFGGRDALTVVALALAALVSCGVGSLLGALPRLSLDLRQGLSSGLACLLALFAGLYGPSAMELADWLDAHAPALQAINPAVQITDALYALRYYDALGPFVQTLGVLVVMAAVLLAVSAILMGRGHHAQSKR